MTSNGDDERDPDIKSYVDMSHGFLTSDDREYIAGIRDVNDAQVERNIRQRIRDRTLTTFLDFRAIEHSLDQKDRELIFNRLVEESTKEQIEELRGGENQIQSTKESWFGGIVATLQFIYEGLDDVGIDSKAVFDHAVRNAEIGELSEENIRAITEKIEADEELTQVEKQLLIRLFIEDPEEFANRLAAINIDFETKAQSDEYLEPGVSFAMLGYMMKHPDCISSDTQQILHEEVKEIAFPGEF